MKIKRFIYFALIASMFSVSTLNNMNTVNAAGIKIQYDGQSVDYSDTQVSYSLNGNIVKSKYPGIIIDGVSLASLKDIFINSGMGIKYKYNKKSGTVTLTRGSDKLSFKLNSVSGKFNGSDITFPLAPRYIKFSNGADKIYVPARFVAQSFGFSYTWNSSTGIAAIEGEVKTPAKTGRKISYNGKTYNYKDAQILYNANGNILNSDKTPGIYIKSVLMAPASEIFLNDYVEGGFKYNKKKKTAVITFDDYRLNLTLDSKNAKLNGKKVKLSQAPVMVNYIFSKKTALLVPIEDICDLFRIEINIKDSVAELVLPDYNDDDENENGSDADTSGHKKDENKDDQKGDKDINNGIKKTDANLFSWAMSGTSAITDISGSVKTLTGLSANPLSTSSILNILQLENSAQGQFNTYQIISSEGFYNVNGNLLNNEFSVVCENVSSPDGSSYPFNGGGMAASALTSFDNYGKSTKIKFNLNTRILGYELSLSEDFKILTVKLYKNTVTSVAGEYKNGSYTITLSGLAPFEAKATEKLDSNVVNFKITDMADGIGVNSYTSNDTDTSKLLGVNYTPDGTGGILLTVTKTADYGYYTKASGNSVQIVITDINSIKYAVNIPIQDGIDINSITDTDNYSSNNFTITIPGDVRAFFESNPIICDMSKIKDFKTELNYLGNTVITFNTYKLQAYKINATGKMLGIEVDEPKNLYSKIVVIDPGHGGGDTGTVSLNGVYTEKAIVLAMAYTYFKDLIKDPALKIYWTRTADVYPTLTERAKFASKVGADLFISVHVNAVKGNTKPKGTEVYYSVRNNTLQPNGLSSYVMASTFLKNITSELSTYNRGVKTAPFVVTNINTVPAVLIETAFITNKDDLERLIDIDFQKEMAEILYNTIEELFDSYPTGR